MIRSLISVITLLIILLLTAQSHACTAAVVSAKATRDGRPMLWKNRDTSAVDNKVEYIPGNDGEYSYVALFNASDADCDEAWIGMNNVGFAIMNTASYNLKADNVPSSQMDGEGILMTAALKSCRTVADFAEFLDKYPKPMGVEANFGVMDAAGTAAVFETNNYSYTRFNADDAPQGVIIVSNFSRSGRPGEGYGQIRYNNAAHLLKPYLDNHTLTPEVFTEELSRSFYHSLMGKDFAASGDVWLVDQDFIPRYKSSASVVIEGITPVADATVLTSDEITSQYIMWTAIGYPPCAEIMPVWCRRDGVESSLRGIAADGRSPQSDIVKARRDDVFCAPDGNSDKYIRLDKLFNAQGTGYCQNLKKQNLGIYNKIRKLREPLSGEYAK